MLPEVSAHFDDWGMIVNRDDRDGGDAAHRMGHYLLCLWHWDQSGFKIDWAYEHSRITDFCVAMHLAHLEHPKKHGLWRRHPDPMMWYSEWNRFSRDQWVPVACVLGIAKLGYLLKPLAVRHLKRGMFFWNTRRNGATRGNHGQVYKWENGREVRRNWHRKLPDWGGPESWGIYIRGLHLWPLAPLLYLCDLETLLTSVWLRWVAPAEDDITNHLAPCILGAEIFTTPLNRLARHILGVQDLLDRNEKYWTKAQRPKFMSLLYEPLIRQYFNHKG